LRRTGGLPASARVLGELGLDEPTELRLLDEDDVGRIANCLPKVKAKKLLMDFLPQQQGAQERDDQCRSVNEDDRDTENHPAADTKREQSVKAKRRRHLKEYLPAQKRAKQGAGDGEEASPRSHSRGSGRGVGGVEPAAGEADSMRYPFKVDPLDHCETSSRAYKDLAVVLGWYCRTTKHTARGLQIYDPYYCDGAVKRHLAAEGFASVYNQQEDFYAVLAEGRLPPHDMVVTNPPYSEDHIERCLDFLVGSGKPWCALLPNYVYTNDYYKRIVKPVAAPVFLIPLERYDYWMPEHARDHAPEHVSRDDGCTSPFLSSWYIWLGYAFTERAYQFLDHFQTCDGVAPKWIVAKAAKGSYTKWKIQSRWSEEMAEDGVVA